MHQILTTQSTVLDIMHHLFEEYLMLYVSSEAHGVINLSCWTPEAATCWDKVMYYTTNGLVSLLPFDIH